MALSIRPGDSIRLTGVPADLLAGLPVDDQAAISASAGCMTFVGIDHHGRSELEFRYQGASHTIWINPADAHLIQAI